MKGVWPLALPALGLYLPSVVWLMAVASDPGEPGGFVDLTGAGSAIVNSTCIAAGSTLLAVLLGGGAALLLEGFAVRARGLLSVLLLLPFLSPPAVLTTAAHMTLAGTPLGFLTRDITGAVFISGLRMAPLVLWGVARALASIPVAERDALRSALPPGRALGRVLLPRVLPAAGCLAVLVFLLTWPQMEIPGYTGVRATIGMRTLASFTAHQRDAEGWLLVLLSAVVALALVGVAARALAGAAARPLGEPLGEERPAERTAGARWASVLLWGIALGQLALLAGPLAELGGVAPVAVQKPALALLVEVPRALLVAGIVSVLGWRLAERAHPVAGLLFVLPLLLPGSLPALALVRIQHLLPTAVLDVPLLLSLAQATRFAGVAYVLGRIAHASLPDGERNAAQVLPPFTRRWRVLFPRALPALATSTLVVSVLVLGEVECTNLLVPPGYVSPVLALHNFLHFRYDADAAALAVLLAAIGGALALLLVRLGRGLR